MISNEEIGRRIESRRLELGLTMGDIADKIGVAKSTIQRYEKGKIDKIKLPIIESFASALGLNPDWIIGKSEIKFRIGQIDRSSSNILRIAGRDGSYLEKQLTDEQLAALRAIVDQLPEADDL